MITPTYPPAERQPIMLLDAIVPSLVAEETIAREAAANGRTCGALTGFKALDFALGGYLMPGLHILHAEPGAGKTALCLQIGSRCACPALYITAEMRPVDLLRRCAARATGTPLGRLRGGELSEDALAAILNTTIDVCPMLAILDAATADVLPNDIAVAATGLKARFESPHILIILDSLTDWAASTIVGAKHAATDYEANEAALTALKAIALCLACPIITIVHRNRAGQSAGAEKQLFSAKGTGRIEYIAESLWVLAATDKDDATGKRSVTLSLAKNRYGPTRAPITLKFEGRLQKFTEV